jgi:hypothetical protein
MRGSLARLPASWDRWLCRQRLVDANSLALALRRAQTGPMLSAETPERLYSIEELVELRRNTLRYARSVPAGDERNKHRQVALSLRILFRGEKWLQAHTRKGLVSWPGNESRHAELVRQR